MVSPDKAIQALSNRLPEHSGAIESAFDESAEFRSICADFYICSRALVYWSDVGSDDANTHREEYGALLQEITQEALTWLQARQEDAKPNA